MINRADPEDAKVISVLLEESFKEYKHLYTSEGYNATVLNEKEITLRIQTGISWIFWYDTHAAGTLSGQSTAEGFYLCGMAVRPLNRGLNIGRSLLVTAENHCLKNGMERMYLCTTPFLAPSIHIYEKFGFKKVDAPHKNLFGTALIAMEKFIKEEM